MVYILLYLQYIFLVFQHKHSTMALVVHLFLQKMVRKYLFLVAEGKEVYFLDKLALVVVALVEVVLVVAVVALVEVVLVVALVVVALVVVALVEVVLVVALVALVVLVVLVLVVALLAFGDHLVDCSFVLLYYK